MFHVQTEDSGLNNPRIFTHLFHEGVIVATKKVDYDAEADAEVVKGLMQAQHKAVLRELRRGAYDQRLGQLLGEEATPSPVLSDETVKTPMPEMGDGIVDEGGDEEEYAQIIVDDSSVSMVHGTLEPKDDDDLDVSGAFRRLSGEQRRGATPNPVTVSPSAAIPRQPSTWMLTRTGQQERPFDKSGPVQSAPPQVPTAIPSPIPPIPSPPRPEGRRRTTTPIKLPEVPTPPPPPLVQRGKRNLSPTGPLPSQEVRRPPAPVTTSATGSRANTAPIVPVVTPAPRASSAGIPRTPKTTDSIVVARPAVVIGAPGASDRKPGGDGPPESIFGQDLISEKSLDEVIMAYLSEDANDD